MSNHESAPIRRNLARGAGQRPRSRGGARLERLAVGEYRAACKEVNFAQAVVNGHSAVWPHARAVSDGDWVRFYQGGKEVFSCNPVYAAAHFTCEPACSSK